MTTPTNSHKAWTNKGGHVKPTLQIIQLNINFFAIWVNRMFTEAA